ncbi:MAG: hypothetical protein E7568_05005 [Ruminococcaceae bacterium]|nr:hypothetical protein [Oscillospiraceae bacterium]
MKSSGVVHLRNFKFISVLRDNIGIVVFTLLFTLGVLIGTLLFSSDFFIDEANSIVEIFSNLRSSGTYLKIFSATFVFSFAFLFAVFLFGTSLLGIAFVPFIVAIRGVFSGLLLSGIYTRYALDGITLNMLTLIPSTIICVLVLIKSATESLNFSYSLGKLAINEERRASSLNIKYVIKRFCLYILITVIGCLFEALLAVVFKKFFVLG